MSTIHILDANTDELVAFLTNEGERLFWDDLHVEDIRSHEDTFEFVTPSTVVSSGRINERSRLLIPADGEGYREFVVLDMTTSMDGQKRVLAEATYMDIESQYIVSPGKYTGTIIEHLATVLPDTEWETGYIEYSGIRTIEIDEHIGAYSFLRRLATAFEAELQFRVETSGNTISGRYVDFRQHVGEVTQKEIEIGKDLIDVEMQVNSERVVTQLLCIGPEREDGTWLEVVVSDDEAFQRWNRKGKHIRLPYTPESSNEDMTIEQLTQYGMTELNKRIASVVDYRIEAVSLEEKFPHERVRIGDSIRVKNPEFEPAIYATARILRVERSISGGRTKVFEIGEVVTYNESDILSLLKELQTRYTKKINTLNKRKNSVYRQDTKPSLANKFSGDVWINTAEGNKISVYNETVEDFVETKLDYQALAVGQLSAISADLGIVTAGEIYGVLIDSSTFTSSGTSPYGEQMELLLNSGIIRISTNEKGVWVDSNTIRMRDFIGLSGEHDRFYARLEDTTGNMVLGSTTYNSDPSGSPFPGGPVEMDLQPNFNYEVKVKNGLRHEGGSIVTTQEETGRCGAGGIAVSGITSAIAGNAVNFKTKKTYIPATITRTPISATAASLQIARITEEGFWCYVDGDNSGAFRFWDGTYQA